jgi:protein SCO1/2
MKASSLATHRSFVWLILLAAIAAALGLWLGSHAFRVPPTPTLKNAVLYPQPRPVPDFQLTRSDGQPFTLADWKGHWSVVYFGYTHCPDVCPTTLATFKQVWNALGERGLQDRLRIDFISVDPQRDTPKLLHDYVTFFSPAFTAATGSDAELTALTRSLGMVYSRSTNADGSIEVDHSGSAVIIDPRGRLLGLFRPPFSAADVSADLAALMGAGS